MFKKQFLIMVFFLLKLNTLLFSEHFQYEISEPIIVDIICDNLVEINDLINISRSYDEYRNFTNELDNIFLFYISEIINYQKELDLAFTEILNNKINQLNIPKFIVEYFEGIMLRENNFKDYLIIIFALNLIIFEEEFIISEESPNRSFKNVTEMPEFAFILNNIARARDIFDEETIFYIKICLERNNII